ncbi:MULTISPECIES: hypothetical protein [unclassified Nostoc]|uniref:hypothetical protein n=1 Tax=unclassified Nostoc TaxID=2593658 RepID=UPI00294FF43D|nr:hypothetical protein [Nostoc sp. 'Peltigera membranacea cyanobiont' 232]
MSIAPVRLHPTHSLVCNKCLTFAATDTIGDTTGGITEEVTGSIGDVTGGVTGEVTAFIGDVTGGVTEEVTVCIGDLTGDIAGATLDPVGIDGVSVKALTLGWSKRENPATSTRNTAVTSHRVNFLEFD